MVIIINTHHNAVFGLHCPTLLPVLDEFEPQSELRITYHMTRMLQMGTTIEPQEVEERPHVWFSKTNDVSQYSLVLVGGFMHIECGHSLSLLTTKA